VIKSSTDHRPCFLVTIDTEGDNSWSRPAPDTTRNAEFLGRFQELCEAFALKPTYLTNYEMSQNLTFRELGEDILARGTGEIGMHLHAWNSPPLIPLTPDDRRHLPYLIEYDEATMRGKVHALTATLEDAFGVKMLSHRAGRWSFDERYAQILIENGYVVDCSVTPLISWADAPGDPGGPGGTDYRAFPRHAYWLDSSDISRPGNSPLLEVPVTVLPGEPTLARRTSESLQRLPQPLATLAHPLRRVCNRLTLPIRWLRPNGKNRQQLLGIVTQVLEEKHGYAEFMLHSSELMPGGSPTFANSDHIEALYEDLEALFEATRDRFAGSTLAEFHSRAISNPAIAQRSES
jgi:hypothetical protein